jgi:hypothetical protein
MTSRPPIFALWVVMALGAGGCRSSRITPAPPIAPAPVAAAAAPAPTPEAAVPTPASAPPAAAAPAPATVAPQPPSPAPVIHPPTPKPGPAEAPAPPPLPPPAFGQILTPQQQTEFRVAYRQSAEFARQTLSQLSGRPLSRDQADTANRVRSFLSQADEAQSKDPSAAAQLARRAELLARDLLNSFR